VSILTLKRDASAFIRAGGQERPGDLKLSSAPSGPNPSFLQMKASPSRADTLVSFGLPALMLDQNTRIVSATLVVTPSVAVGGNRTLFASMPTKSWAASGVRWVDNVGEEAELGISVANAGPTNPFRLNVKSHIESIRSGRRFYGWRLRTANSAAWTIRNNNDLMPTLVIEYYRVPGKPVVAAPTNGQVVDKPKPLLKLQRLDPDLTTIDAIQVVTAANPNMDPWVWDSGIVLTTETQLDLAKTSFPALTVQGQSTFWSARLRGIGGDWSPWSDGSEFIYETLGTAQITYPPDAPNNVVGEQTAGMAWVTTGFQQEFLRALLYDNETGARLWDSGWIQSREQTIYPPAGLITRVGHEYKWQVYVTDGQNRTLVGDNEAYAGDTQTFRYELSADVTPVQGLVAVDMAPLPFVKLVWDREAAANQYEVVRDGVSRALVQLEEVLQPDGKLGWVDYQAAPRRSHTWTVRSVVNGRTSSSNPTVSKTIEPAGVWLYDIATGEYVTVITDKQQTAALSEDGGVFTPLNARFGIRVTTSLHGYSGSVVGEILKTDLTGEETGQVMRDRFLRMRERKSTPMSLVLADAAYKVIPFNMTITESPQVGRNGDYVYPCSFDFIQVG
jgi:hypothetical protein